MEKCNNKILDVIVERIKRDAKRVEFNVSEDRDAERALNLSILYSLSAWFLYKNHVSIQGANIDMKAVTMTEKAIDYYSMNIQPDDDFYDALIEYKRGILQGTRPSFEINVEKENE